MSKFYSEKTFLAKTIEKLSTNGKTPDDVRYVLVPPGYIYHEHQEKRWQKGSWEDFAKLANKPFPRGFWPNSGDVNTESSDVESDLLIVGDDWWLERWLQDEFGCAGWEFKTLPVVPQGEETIPLKEFWNDDLVMDREEEEEEVHPHG